MYKLMIVDDEPFTVDGLHALVQDMNIPDLEIYTSYTARQAMEIMDRLRMDIIISDIVMPGMSGLELQEHVIRQWPRCKFIFLTGHDKFDFIHQALENDSIDYILKDGHDENVKNAIEKAIKKIEEESHIKDLLQKSGYYKEQALTGLQRDLVLDILAGDKKVLLNLKKEFLNLDIGLDPASRIYMFLLSVEAWGEFISNSEKSTARFAIKNIIEELLMPITRAFIINVDRHSMIVFVQPRQAIHGEPEESREAVEKRIRLFVNEMVGDVHKYIRENLGITVSIVTSKDFVGWESAGNKYVTLRIILNSNAGMKNGSITIEKDISDENESIRMSLDKTMNNIRELISRMDDCIQLMQDKEFFVLMNEIRKIRDVSGNGQRYLDSMIYNSLLAVLFSNLGLLQCKYEDACLDNPARPVLLNEHPSWNEAVDYLNGIAEALFSGRRNMSVEYTEKLIMDVQNYINENLSSDISLSMIADRFGYNSNYFSQLYKSITGEGVFDYISKRRIIKAKELLKDPKLKINNIANTVGLKTSSYFTRFFKRATGYTPQEYRNMIQ